MRITEIKLYVVQLPNNTPLFDLSEETVHGRRRWLRRRS